jgi:hypothetical protein
MSIDHTNFMNEAPKTIYLSSESGSFDWEDPGDIDWHDVSSDAHDIEYIRKDIHDQAQARINTLEKALKFYADCSHKKTIFHTEYLDTETVVEDGTIARNALEKE